MENDGVADLGPRPSRAAAIPTLSRARNGVLALLAAQDRPTTLATLSSLSGLHENTLRDHLDGLARLGLVARERAEPHGRGRPAWLWRVQPTEVDEYAGLAGALARTLRRTSKQPAEDAVAAGEAWGRDLAATRTATKTGSSASATPARRLRDLLDRVGFAPEGKLDRAAGSADFRLTRCPLLEVAQEEPEIVCNVHLGLAVGALKEYGATDPDAQLTPFAEPGACVLRLRAAGDS